MEYEIEVWSDSGYGYYQWDYWERFTTDGDGKDYFRKVKSDYPKLRFRLIMVIED